MRILTFPAWNEQPVVTTPPLDKGYCGIAIGPDSAEGLVLCEGFPLQGGRVLPIRERKYRLEHIRPLDPRIVVVGVAAAIDLTGTHHATLTWHAVGVDGNAVTIDFQTGGTGTGDLENAGSHYTFNYESGVTTMGDFVAAAAGIFVVTGDTPADVLTDPGDSQGPLDLVGGIDPSDTHDPGLDCIQNLSVIVFEDPAEMGSAIPRPNLNFFSTLVVTEETEAVPQLALSIPFVGRRQCAITFHSDDLASTFGFLVKGVRYQYSAKKIVRYDGPTAATQALDENNSYSIDIGGTDSAELWDALEVYLFSASGTIDVDADTVGEIGAW